MRLPVSIAAPFAALLALAAPAFAEVEIQEVTSPGGIEAWLVEEPSIPFTALEIRFRGGSALDAPGKRGATALMTYTLEEGTGDMDARAFAAAREALAASYDFDLSPDTISISARFLTENRDEAVALLRGAIVEPSFTEEATERVKAQMISSIRSDATDPSDIAREAFAAAAYGEDHPYGSSQDGTVESVSALAPEDLHAAHDAALARDRVYVGAVGDISAEELGLLLDELLGDLPATGAPYPEMADISLDGGVTVIPFDTPQSVVVFGHEGIARDDPDYVAAYVLNEVLGGSGRQSRLMEEVREKRGLTYGVYSYLAPRDLGNLYLGSLNSANDTVAEAIEVIEAEWARIAEEGLSEEELEGISTYLTGAYPLRFDGNATIAGTLVGMQMVGLPTSYVTDRNALVEALTVEEIDRVAKRLFDPDGLSFVVVGRPEGLEADG